MSDLACIDLAADYGSRYRIDYEPHVDQWPRIEHAWLARIRCLHGYVGVQGGDRLHAFTDRPVIGARLRRLPFVERSQGHAEVRIVFHVDHLAAVLAILKPYRRRQLTDEQRARLTATGRAALARNRAAVNVQGDSTALESSRRAPDVPTGGQNEI